MNWSAFFGVIAGCASVGLFFLICSLPILPNPAWWLGGFFAVASLSGALSVGLGS